MLSRTSLYFKSSIQRWMTHNKLYCVQTNISNRLVPTCGRNELQAFLNPTFLTGKVFFFIPFAKIVCTMPKKYGSWWSDDGAKAMDLCLGNESSTDVPRAQHRHTCHHLHHQPGCRNNAGSAPTPPRRCPCCILEGETLQSFPGSPLANTSLETGLNITESKSIMSRLLNNSTTKNWSLTSDLRDCKIYIINEYQGPRCKRSPTLPIICW